jgi:hypothetical protein
VLRVVCRVIIEHLTAIHPAHVKTVCSNVRMVSRVYKEILLKLALGAVTFTGSKRPEAHP